MHHSWPFNRFLCAIFWNFFRLLKLYIFLLFQEIIYLKNRFICS